MNTIEQTGTSLLEHPEAQFAMFQPVVEGLSSTQRDVRDIDGMMRLFPPIGDGVMDYQAIVATLKQVGFNGFASIEQDTHPGDPEMRVICQRYLKMMREYIG